VQDDEDVVVVLVQLRAVVARIDVLEVERMEVEVGLQPVSIGRSMWIQRIPDASMISGAATSA
jgi:hypothetical protein